MEKGIAASTPEMKLREISVALVLFALLILSRDIRFRRAGQLNRFGLEHQVYRYAHCLMIPSGIFFAELRWRRRL